MYEAWSLEKQPCLDTRNTQSTVLGTTMLVLRRSKVSQSTDLCFNWSAFRFSRNTLPQMLEDDFGYCLWWLIFWTYYLLILGNNSICVSWIFLSVWQIGRWPLAYLAQKKTVAHDMMVFRQAAWWKKKTKNNKYFRQKYTQTNKHSDHFDCTSWGVGNMPCQSGNKMLDCVLNKFGKRLREEVDMAIGRIKHMTELLGHLSACFFWISWQRCWWFN